MTGVQTCALPIYVHAHRAAVLREGADEIDAHAAILANVSDDPAAFVAKARTQAATEWQAGATLLRRMADGKPEASDD